MSEPQRDEVQQAELDSIKSVYEICIDTRNFEINQLIQRNNFFMLFQGVLLAAVLQNEASKPVVEVVICVAGVFVSLYQLQMACGAKFWQEWWESRVDHYEGKLRSLQVKQSGHFFDLFATSFDQVHKEIEQRFRKTRGFSLTDFLILRAFAVGRAPIKVSLTLLIAWIFLTVHVIDLGAIANWSNPVKGFTFSQQSSAK